jgi:heavy metal translocating P-type ATPase
MKKIVISFVVRVLFPVALIVYADLHRSHPLSLTWAALIALTVALLPTVRKVAARIAARRFDVGMSMLFTIYLLIFIGSTSIAAIFVLLMISGDLFRDIVLYRVKKSLERITVYLPHTGFVKASDGTIQEIDIEDIKTGDIIAVKPGGRAPADGTLLAQEALLDESVISGESRPIAVAQGGDVPAGAVNAGDYFEMQASRVGENSTVAQIRKIAEEAGKEKTPITRFIDQYAKYTSLTVAVLVVILYLATGDLFRALGLWIAMVPIVFAIIGPVAVSIGVSTAARLGILVKKAETIEDLTKIAHIVFDKTGTLTIGSPTVRGIILPQGSPLAADALLALTAGLEKRSEHEIARAIVKEAEDKNITAEKFSEVHVIKGGGLTAMRGKDEIAVGSKKLLEEKGVSFPADFLASAAEREARGETPVFIAKGTALLGGIFVADTLRKETPDAIAVLKNEGYDMRILTGDDRAVAHYVAGELGLPETAVMANLSPQDKIDNIRALEANHERTIMVGDGINDAPALSAATVGIAMGVRGTDLATNAAGVVLVEENFLKIPAIIGHAKRIVAVIKEDLVIATVIHVAAGALSAFGIITLVQTAIFHEISSVIVLANTSRLFSVRRRAM